MLLAQAAPSSATAEAAYTPEVRRQQQIHLVQQVPLMAAVNISNGSLVTWVLWDANAAWLCAVWFGLLFTGSVLQFAGWWRVRHRPPPKTSSGKGLREAQRWAFVMGAFWGSAILFFSPDSVELQMFLCVVLAGMAAGLTSILNPLPQLTTPFACAALMPLAVVLLSHGTSLHITVAILAMIFLLMLVQGSFRAYRQLRDLVRTAHALQETRADLVDAIESTRDGFALFGADGAIALANRRFREWFPEAATPPGEEHDTVQKVGGRWLQSAVYKTSRGGLVSVHTDVTTLKEREEELLAANKEANEANRAKTEFLANMSHELRTPLNAIIGFSEMMHAEMFGKLGSPKYLEYTTDITNSAKHLLSIIGDILDLSKIESAKYKLAIAPVDAAETLRWVANVCQQQTWLSGRAPIEVEVAPDFGPVLADPRALKQIMLNLVNNAVKFTPETGHVGIRAFIDASGAPTMQVWDTGIGIPSDKIELVRLPFQQVESAFQRRYQGTGLGLSISDALVKLHGGRLDIESTEHVGTTITVRLPAAARVDNPLSAAQ